MPNYYDFDEYYDDEDDDNKDYGDDDNKNMILKKLNLKMKNMKEMKKIMINIIHQIDL